ncbi:MAG: hypothetical protein FWE45_01805 [Firmicutes bacterium]|nr:hypothetical protein [Bacillota bacterium]
MEKKSKLREFVKGLNEDVVGLGVGATIFVGGIAVGASMGHASDVAFNESYEQRLQNSYERRLNADEREFERTAIMLRNMGVEIDENGEQFLIDSSEQRMVDATNATTETRSGTAYATGIVGGLVGLLGGMAGGFGASIGVEKMQDYIRDKEWEERREARRRKEEELERVEEGKRQDARDDTLALGGNIIERSL